jgi:hypothetical protein
MAYKLKEKGWLWDTYEISVNDTLLLEVTGDEQWAHSISQIVELSFQIGRLEGILETKRILKETVLLINHQKDETQVT